MQCTGREKRVYNVKFGKPSEPQIVIETTVESVDPMVPIDQTLSARDLQLMLMDEPRYPQLSEQLIKHASRESSKTSGATIDLYYVHDFTLVFKNNSALLGMWGLNSYCCPVWANNAVIVTNNSKISQCIQY